MSETAIQQPLHEKVKEPHRSLAIEANSTDTSTNAASDMKSDSALSPGESQFTNSTDDCEEYTPEEIKHLEATTQKLNNEAVEKHNYKKEFQDIKAIMEKTLSSQLPFSVKLKMMESAMDRLKTKISCVSENNRNFKAKIAETNKCNPQNGNEADGSDINKTKEERDKNSTLDGTKIIAENKEDPEINENKKQEELDQAAALVKIAETKKISEGLREENEKLEEAIAEMKQQRNLLLVTIEDTRDDFDDIQYLIKEKKNALDKKVIYTEELRRKIALDSSNKPSSRASGSGTHRKTISDAGSFTVRNHIPSVIGDKITDISTSVFNTTVFQDVSSKLTNMFGSVGRALGMTREDVNPEQILSADFMRELNNQNVQLPRANSSNNNNPRPTPQTGKAPQATKKAGNSPSKTHTRTQSSNITSSTVRK